MSSFIRAGKATARRPSPAVPFNVLSPSRREQPALHNGVSGPSTYAHDNEYQDFRKIRILPTTDEILSVEKPIYIPKKDLCEANPIPPGPERLRDLLFRQLRFDSLEHVRDVCYSAAQICFLLNNSASYLQTNSEAGTPVPSPRLKPSFSTDEDGIGQIKQETCAGNRYFLYRDVQIEEMVPHEQKSVLVRISYMCPKFMRSSKLNTLVYSHLIYLHRFRFQVLMEFRVAPPDW